MYKLGFIGTGNMGGALALAAARRVSSADIILSNRTRAKAEALAETLGSHVGDNADVAESSRFIVLGIKPQTAAETLSGIAPVLSSRGDGFVLISMAVGMTTSTVCRLAGGEYPVIRIMPNTPVSVGRGVVLCCRNSLVTDGDYAEFKSLFSGAGALVEVAENLIDAGAAVSGCGPAFAALFIDALADGGVYCGLPRADAIVLAAQTLAGTADLLMQSGKHPDKLKDEVCSPGGTTIAGVLALEENGFRNAVTKAVVAAFDRTKELSGEK